jgi:D-alanyl-D-alanine carboxypeptidase
VKLKQMRPLTLTSNSHFRPNEPNPPTSDEYAVDRRSVSSRENPMFFATHQDSNRSEYRLPHQPERSAVAGARRGTTVSAQRMARRVRAGSHDSGGTVSPHTPVQRRLARKRWLPLLLATIVAGSGCGASGENAANPRPLERPDLQQTLRKLAEEQHSGAVALVVTSKGTWQGASGYAAGKRRTDSEDRFGIASTTKTFVATVVLQLVGEGRLSLDDSVERWLPGRLREGRRITIRQLMNHTSGLPQDVSFALAPRNAQQPLLFPPGTAHSYSNLNYVVLGLIVEKATGMRLDRVVRDRIFRPLGLEDSSYGTAALRPHAGRMPAWLGSPEEPSGPVNGAGGIVSTAADLARFFRALVSGELLGEDLLAEMTQAVDAGTEAQAGLGIFQINTPCGSPWGHGGDDLAYSNQVLASQDGQTIVVVAQNTTGWPSVEEKAEEMYCRAL